MVDGSRELPHSLSSYFSKPNRIYRSLVLLFSRDITCIASAVRLEKREREERHTPTHTQKVNIGFLNVRFRFNSDQPCKNVSRIISLRNTTLSKNYHSRTAIKARDCRQHFACSSERWTTTGGKLRSRTYTNQIMWRVGTREREWGVEGWWAVRFSCNSRWQSVAGVSCSKQIYAIAK
jgi:hypothetical protein